MIGAHLVATMLLSAAPQQVVAQTACSMIEGKQIDVAKKELLEAARRGAVEQLFGSFVASLTQVEDLRLRKEEIQTASLGFVRLAGDPVFYNGDSLGEVCVKILAHATEEDRLKLQPRSLSKKTCVSEGDVRQIRQVAEQKAILDALVEFDGNLRSFPEEKVRPLLREVKFSEGGFVPDTSTYCVRVAGVTYPVEASLLALGSDSEEQEARWVKGLCAEYFNVPPFGANDQPQFPMAEPNLARVDEKLDFDWYLRSPGPDISADYFLTRWRGELFTTTSGTYQFILGYNAAAGLSVGGAVVLQDWVFSDGDTARSTYRNRQWRDNRYVNWYSMMKDIFLAGGKWHTIEVRYGERSEDAGIALSWRPPGASEFEFVPTERLRCKK